VGCRIHVLPMTAVSDSLGAVWLSNPRSPYDSSSLMISHSIGAVWAVESTRHP